MDSEEPQVHRVAFEPKLRHPFDRLGVHVPQESHPRGERFTVRFVLGIEAVRNHEQVSDDESPGNPGVFSGDSDDGEPVGGAVVHPVVHELQPIDEFGLPLLASLAKVIDRGLGAEGPGQHGVGRVLLVGPQDMVLKFSLDKQQGILPHLETKGEWQKLEIDCKMIE